MIRRVHSDYRDMRRFGDTLLDLGNSTTSERRILLNDDRPIYRRLDGALITGWPTSHDGPREIVRQAAPVRVVRGRRA